MGRTFLSVTRLADGQECPSYKMVDSAFRVSAVLHRAGIRPIEIVRPIVGLGSCIGMATHRSGLRNADKKVRSLRIARPDDRFRMTAVGAR